MFLLIIKKNAIKLVSIKHLLDRSDVFIMPSFYEALGCVYLEAMAMKLPTIGVKGQGIDEIIVNGTNGFLVAPQSSSSIYHILRWVYIHNSQAGQIAERGYNTVKENYRWLDSAEELMKVYNKLVD